jgi:hypothetical protein
LKTDFLAVCALPVILFCTAGLGWTFKELSDTITIMREREQPDKLRLYLRFRNVLIGIAVVATLTVLFQAIDTFKSVSIRWHYQWFPNIGVSHIIFYLILVAFMVLWAPHTNSDVYAYSEHVATADDVEDGIDNTVMDDEPSGNKIAPASIGRDEDDL